ncbi:glycosyltransferase family 9 protein [Billgrantia endophytica]|uniref:Lipopolysaccharide heptosyltransferase family protein n=1 Tax=Billgrantia endophytica TaxID=2033802 RepID=A0A2N7TXY5_9GAMM|nr:glycosyltransferase family 9 protein [Halomonas endophytica]PMR73041.1 hypothetical protein C1H69_18855 [Halomonas endophytica]
MDDLNDLRRVVFLRWDAKWGDSIIFSSVLPALRKLDGDVLIEVITTPEMAPLFADYFGVDQVHIIRKRPSRQRIRRLAKSLGSVDLLVHFSEIMKPRDLYLAHCVGARHLASLDDSPGLVDVKLGNVTKGLHMEDRYHELLRRCGIHHTDKHYMVPREPVAEAAVASFLQPRKRPYIAINPFSKGRAKTFNVATTQALIERTLATLPDHDVCLLTMPGCEHEVAAISARWDTDRCFYYPQTRTIYDNVALLARAEGQVSASTSSVHIADGVGVPSFVLFSYGPSEMSAWHSVHPLSVNLMSQPGEVNDVNRLDWQEVDRALASFLTRVADSPSRDRAEKAGCER